VRDSAAAADDTLIAGHADVHLGVLSGCEQGPSGGTSGGIEQDTDGSSIEAT